MHSANYTGWGGGTGVRADERLGDPPSQVDPGAFSGQRQGWKPPRGPSGSAVNYTKAWMSRRVNWDITGTQEQCWPRMSLLTSPLTRGSQ